MAEQDKIKKLQTYDSSLFISQSYFRQWWIANFLMFQPFYKTFKRPTGLVDNTVLEWESRALSSKYSLFPKLIRMHNSRRLWWWWIVFVVWLTDKRHLALFPVGNIVIDSHHLEFSTRRDQDLNLCRTWVQALMNEVVQ